MSLIHGQVIPETLKMSCLKFTIKRLDWRVRPPNSSTVEQGLHLTAPPGDRSHAKNRFYIPRCVTSNGTFIFYFYQAVNSYQRKDTISQCRAVIEKKSRIRIFSLFVLVPPADFFLRRIFLGFHQNFYLISVCAYTLYQ